MKQTETSPDMVIPKLLLFLLLLLLLLSSLFCCSIFSLSETVHELVTDENRSPHPTDCSTRSSESTVDERDAPVSSVHFDNEQIQDGGQGLSTSASVHTFYEQVRSGRRSFLENERVQCRHFELTQILVQSKNVLPWLMEFKFLIKHFISRVFKNVLTMFSMIIAA